MRFSKVEDMGPLAAIDFLRDKKVVLKQDFDALAEQYRPYAFTVAHVESTSTLTLAHGELQTFLASGAGLGEFQASITEVFQRRGITPLAPHHIENVFRTNMQTAYNAGRWTELMDPEMAPFFPVFEYHNPRDERSRLTHAAMAKPGANRFRRDDPIWQIWWPPNGYNCFLPGTEVSGRFVGGLRARYSGPVWDITTSKGNRLTCTPNHPILTTVGWKQISQLCKGDTLFSYSGEVQLPLLGSVNDQNRPALIEDVFDALVANGTSRLGRTTDLDLHGDAAYTDGDIHVVGSDRVLAHSTEPGGFQSSNDLSLVPALAGHSEVHGSSHFEPFFETSLPSSGGFPGSLALLGDNGFKSGVLPSNFPFEVLGLGPAANFHVMLAEDPGKRITTHPLFVGELLKASSGGITFDEIVGIREHYFSGHIYDLQSEYGWILAQNIVTSNCRCWVIGVSDPRAIANTPQGSFIDESGQHQLLLPDTGFSHNPGLPEGRAQVIRGLLDRTLNP